MNNTPSVLLFFIDGLGIGSRGPTNPLDGLDGSEPLAIFQDEESPVTAGGVLIPTDPKLGVEGRPQSASGQTTILTGINAPALLGYHKQGFPNAELRQILSRHSIFLQLKNAGIHNVTFANAYRDRFFVERPRWVSATTAAVEAAGLSFRTIEDVRAGNALYQDFTNQFLIASGLSVPSRTAKEAAVILASIVSAHRFTLFEYFITDKMGHAQDFDGARRTLQNLALMIRELLTLLDLSKTTIVLTSDHGNIEDLSSRNHTLNDVPTIVWGAGRREVTAKIRTLADITPAIFNRVASSTIAG